MANNNASDNCGMGAKTVVVDAVSSVLGGGITFTACIVNAMAKVRPQYHFHVIASSQNFIDRLDLAPNISVYRIPGPSCSFWRFFWRQLVLPWQAVFRKVDVVIAQFPGIFLCSRPQIMLVLNSHYLMEPPVAKTLLQALKRRFQRCLFTLGYRRVDKAVFLSHQMASLPVRWVGPGIGKNEVIYEAVDSNLLMWAKKPQQLSTELNEPYFIAVGSVGYHKNYETMLKAFTELIKQHPNSIRLKIAGYFKELNEYKAGKGKIPALLALTQQLGIDGRVDWLGEVFGENLFSLLRHSLAFVSSSLLEAFPLTAIEAMGAGTCVVVPGTSSYPEVVGEAGLYHDPADPSSMCRQMLRLVKQPEVRKRYCELSQKQVKLYTWKQSAQRYLAIIDGLCEI
jgi:glycosyltransferase involved in cell wall biosynthesis